MKQQLALLILRMCGWSVKSNGEDLKKCVLCVAPHTSNWDFFFGKLAYTALGRNTNFLIKNTWFVFPLNHFFNWIGGVPVDRSRRTNMTKRMVEEFSKRDVFQLAITPEGTRKCNPNWKRGFYHIAVKAQVPIMMLYIDYKKREAGVFGAFYPTDNEDADIKAIKRKYKGVTACKPNMFALGDID